MRVSRSLDANGVQWTITFLLISLPSSDGTDGG